MIDLLDVLKEVDYLTGFTSEFTTIATRENIPREQLRKRLLLALFALGTAAMGLLLRSPFGHTLLAIRENERRARFLGIPIEQHIWLAFTISRPTSPVVRMPPPP